ncbi:MAG: hypothetical protein V4641_31405 [Pseudomonadota bacterium]
MKKVPKEIQGPWEQRGTAVFFARVAGGFDLRHCPHAEEKARLAAAAPELLAALLALTSNPHLHLEDLVYNVRDREGEGWDGPAVKAWSEAVTAARAVISKATVAQ